MLNYLFSKQFEQALEHGEVALTLARETGNREQLAFVLNDLCRLYTCLGRFDDAYASIEEARGLWQALDHQVMLADSYGSEAEARFNAGEFEVSFQRSSQALQISEQVRNIWGQSYDRMLMAFVRLEQGSLGEGIPLAVQSIQLSDGAGLIASSIGMRSELAWTYAYCGDFETARSLIEQALQVAESKQPQWRAFPQAGKVRIQLLQGDLHSAEQTAGDGILQPISIPYARYTIFLFLANIELAVARREYDRALSLIDGLLEEVAPLTRVDIPDVLRWKGIALGGLGRLDEALQTLTQAGSLAKGMGANLYVWLILADLADVHGRLGKAQEAESNRAEARQILGQIADSLHEIGLRDSFLNQPRVRGLMRS
jgi:tetratricopeptide (TPR) repeat protein